MSPQFTIIPLIRQDWRRRFFILKGSRLFFAKTPYEAPHGMIDLSRCTTVKSADLKSHKKHSFEISTPETTYLLYAGEIYIMVCLKEKYDIYLSLCLLLLCFVKIYL